MNCKSIDTEDTEDTEDTKENNIEPPRLPRELHTNIDIQRQMHISTIGDFHMQVYAFGKFRSSANPS